HLRIFSTNPLDSGDISFPDTIASLAQVWVNTAAHTNHQGQRKSMLLRRWQDHFAQQPVACVVSWKLKISRQRNAHVHRTHPLDPLIEKTAQRHDGSRQKMPIRRNAKARKSS